MLRETLLELWDSAWDGEGWFASWTKALDGLTPEQAAWAPALGRHSIWQIVNHVIFWREYTIAVVEQRPKPDKSDVEKRNFESPADHTEAAWSATKNNLQHTQRAIRAILADYSKPLDRVKHHPTHDAYHLGQVMQLRAMQGLPPVI